MKTGWLILYPIALFSLVAGLIIWSAQRPVDGSQALLQSQSNQAQQAFSEGLSQQIDALEQELATRREQQLILQEQLEEQARKAEQIRQERNNERALRQALSAFLRGELTAEQLQAVQRRTLSSEQQQALQALLAQWGEVE